MSFRLNSLAYLVCGLLLLQAADFVFTYLLLSGGVRADVYESNPLANSILNRGGWLGLAAFKLGITSIILSAVVAVARRRRLAAIRLAVVLCVLMLGVNVYSGALLASPDQTDAIDARTMQHKADLARRMDACTEFTLARDRICDGVLAGRLDTDSALQQMADLVRHFAPRACMPKVARLPIPERHDELALYLDFHLRHRARDRGLELPGASQELVTRGPAVTVTYDPSEPVWLRQARVMN